MVEPSLQERDRYNKLSELVDPCLVKVANGLGFQVAPQWVLTCAHIMHQDGKQLAKGDRVEVTLFGHRPGTRFGEIVYISGGFPELPDLAVVRLESAIRQAGVWMQRFFAGLDMFAALRVADLPELDVPTLSGVPCEYYGFQGGFVVVQPKSPDDRARHLTHQGASGGPVLCVASGEIVGINVARERGDRTFASMLPLGSGLNDLPLDVFTELWRAHDTFHAENTVWSETCDNLGPVHPVNWPVDKDISWQQAAQIYGMLAKEPTERTSLEVLRSDVAKLGADIAGPRLGLHDKVLADLAREYVRQPPSPAGWSPLASLLGLLSMRPGEQAKAFAEEMVALVPDVSTREKLHKSLRQWRPEPIHLAVVVEKTRDPAEGMMNARPATYTTRYYRTQNGDLVHDPGSGPPCRPRSLKEIGTEIKKHGRRVVSQKRLRGRPIIEIFVPRTLMGVPLREWCQPFGDREPLIGGRYPVVLRDLSRLYGEVDGDRVDLIGKWADFAAFTGANVDEVVFPICCLSLETACTPAHERDEHFALLLPREPDPAANDHLSRALHAALDKGFPFAIWPGEPHPVTGSSGLCPALGFHQAVRDKFADIGFDPERLSRDLGNLTWGEPPEHHVMVILLDDPDREPLDLMTPFQQPDENVTREVESW